MEMLKNKLKEWRREKKLPKMIIIIPLLLIGVAGISAVFICNNAGSRLERQLALGDQYLSDMDYERAIAAYEEALRLDDRCVEAYTGIAEAYIQLGDLDMAMEYLELGMERTGSEELGVRLGEVRAIREQLELAKQEEEAVEEEDSEEPEEEPAEPEVTETEEESEEPEEEEVPVRPVRKPKPEPEPEPEETVVEPTPYIPQPQPYIPQPEPVPQPTPEPEPEPAPEPQPPEPEPEPEVPGLPPRGTNMKPIERNIRLHYGTQLTGIPGAVIQAELVDLYNPSVAPILLGNTNDGTLALSATGDSDYQAVRIKTILPEGYYFFMTEEPADVTGWEYNEDAGMYYGCSFLESYEYIDETSFSRWENDYPAAPIVINPSLDGTLTAQPASFTVKAGDIIDLETITLTHTKPDGSAEEVLIEGHTFGSGCLETTGEGLKHQALKTGDSYIAVTSQKCWVKIPVTIEEN